MIFNKLNLARRVKKINRIYSFVAQFKNLTTLKTKAFETLKEKGENAGNQHFLLFPQYFPLYQREKSSF